MPTRANGSKRNKLRFSEWTRKREMIIENKAERAWMSQIGRTTLTLCLSTTDGIIRIIFRDFLAHSLRWDATAADADDCFSIFRMNPNYNEIKIKFYLLIMGIFRNLIPTSYGYQEKAHKHDAEQWNADLPNDNRMRQSVKMERWRQARRRKRWRRGETASKWEITTNSPSG